LAVAVGPVVAALAAEAVLEALVAAAAEAVVPLAAGKQQPMRTQYSTYTNTYYKSQLLQAGLFFT
jgi:hypothetical protein